jgi:hypothetical protein
VTRLSEVVRGVFSFRDVVLQVYVHDGGAKDERPRLDPLVAKRPAHQQISRTQLLVFPIFQARYDRPIFEFDRWFLRSHAISSLIFEMQTVRAAAEAVFPNPQEITTLIGEFLLFRSSASGAEKNISTFRATGSKLPHRMVDARTCK